ncbi:acyl-CoA dehydrogenase [Mycolicibacterium celeriflavum]|uniref:Acyl-CoA dehydrogenase n=1 Tax=Mycolicibacterium celeriflavum TaxID=1249101 RepID=A0A1X0C137_MYCCF|nr:acyl-CoA dehydrogenase family protein [Mycolicibacterium celeriflavum]MCV7238351.1 acyl-CoA dehydrogenase family protein [Mycolicibacterium celeriflavum]OBG23882.1 acyl-CoA dehydrogenase [Mycolicibacterium celeriflavum]ORA50972.1 acyl-CoA dehydrogenase [Mycolicibacterium celeriflavum]BBY44840.1 acyl-CoA dehydrogenase [Mycolicibacterium celeriflavum]
MADKLAEYTFTDEQAQLRDAVGKFSAENFAEDKVRQLMESDPPFDPKVWARLGGELGVLGLSVPEADGGVGGTLVDQAVAIEELGARLACGPLFGTVYLAIPALVAAPTGSARDELLADLVEGRRTAAVAVVDRAGVFEPDAVTVTADGDALSGTVAQVVDGGAADVLLVAARGSDGVALYAVDTAAGEVQRTPLATLDLTRPEANVTFSGASGRLIAGPDETPRVLDHALAVGAALLAVEQVGAAQHLLDLSVEYAKSRLQFGRPIGSFQAVKHRLANLLVDVEHARSTAYHAVWALSDGSDDPALATSIAQAVCSAALSHVANDTIQVHGGIGFTWEHQAHLYYKRAATDAVLLGSAEEHRDRVAAMVLDDATADRVPRVADGQPA